MMYLRSLVLSIVVLLTFSACHRGMICPAFQSSFIQDDSVRMAIFSPFQRDSLPKELNVDKGKYGIINAITYYEKNNSLKTIEMQLVFPEGLPLTDSTQLLGPPPAADTLEYQMTDRK